MQNQLTQQQETKTATPTVETEQQSSEEVKRWLAQMQKDTRLRRRLTAINVCMTVPAGLFSCLFLLHLVQHMNAAVLGMTYAAMGLTWYGSRRLRRGAVENVATLEDVRYVGALVEVLDPKTRVPYPPDLLELVGSTLVRLLPQLKASDTDLLNDGQRAILLSLLGRKERLNLQVAILESFKQIGDARCLPVVERLAARTRATAVRFAAQECLPYLRLRVEEQTARETLLRAGSAPSMSTPETLLRPAEATDVRNEPELLLRAAEGTERHE